MMSRSSGGQTLDQTIELLDMALARMRASSETEPVGCTMEHRRVESDAVVRALGGALAAKEVVIRALEAAGEALRLRGGTHAAIDAALELERQTAEAYGRAIERARQVARLGRAGAEEWRW